MSSLGHRPRSLAVAAALCAFAPAARAATVQKVNKEKDKVLLELTQAELASLEEDQEVVVEFGKTRTITHGILRRLNPVKKTVVLELEEPDPRLAKRQAVRFLSAFWNQSTSPLVYNFGQYHQYPRPFVEGTGGAFTGNLEIDSGEGRKQKADVFGWRFVGSGYLILVPQWLGAGLVFERRDVELKSTTSSPVAAENTVFEQVLRLNRATPGFWIALPDSYRVHARYEYSALENVRGKGKEALTFNYNNGVPTLGVMHVDADGEWGVEYRDKDKFTAKASENVAGVGSVTYEDVRQVPAEVDVAFRSVSDPLFIWGLGLGYVFFEREVDKDQPLQRKPDLPELIRFRATFEHRLADGDKFDWMLTYDGGKAEGLTTLPKTVNSGGFALSYQTLFTTGLTIGGTMTAEYGTLVTKEKAVDPTGAEIEAKDSYAGYQTSLMAFAKYDIDLAVGRGRRR